MGRSEWVGGCGEMGIKLKLAFSHYLFLAFTDFMSSLTEPVSPDTWKDAGYLLDGVCTRFTVAKALHHTCTTIAPPSSSWWSHIFETSWPLPVFRTAYLFSNPFKLSIATLTVKSLTGHFSVFCLETLATYWFWNLKSKNMLKAQNVNRK